MKDQSLKVLEIENQSLKVLEIDETLLENSSTSK